MHHAHSSVLKTGVGRPPVEIEKENRGTRARKKKIEVAAAFKLAVTVLMRRRRTRSGKILRGTIKKIADNRAFTVPATIDDPAILNERSRKALKAKGVRVRFQAWPARSRCRRSEMQIPAVGFPDKVRNRRRR